MKPKLTADWPISRVMLCGGSVAALLVLNSARAVDIYWDGIDGSGTYTDWGTTGCWDLASDGSGGDPANVPGAADVAKFNVDFLNSAAQTINLNGNRSVLGLDFLDTSWGTTLLGGDADHGLTIGTSGITARTLAGPLPVVIGSATSGQKVSITLGGTQAWTNNSDYAVTIHNPVALAGYGLTVAGSSTAGSVAINDLISGTGSLTKTSLGSLTIKSASTYDGPTNINAGTFILSKPNDEDADLINSTSVTVSGAVYKYDVNNRTIMVGTNSVAHSLTFQSGATATLFRAIKMGTSATSNNNTLLITGAGTVLGCNTDNNAGKDLYIGDSGSYNAMTISAGAVLHMPKGGGTNTRIIGKAAGANYNSLTVTGSGSTLDYSTGTAGAPMEVGREGSYNSLTVSAGGYVTTQRLHLGGTSPSGGDNNSVLITGSGSSYVVNSGSNAVFDVGAAGADNNTMTIAAGGSFSFTGSGTTRNFSIGKAGSNNSLTVTGSGSTMSVTFPALPIAIGGMVTGASPGTITENGTGSHLDVSSGGAVTTPSIYLLGTNSAVNLGNGTGISTATVGVSSGFTGGVYLRSATSALNINSGRLIDGSTTVLISGAGTVNLNGAAYFSTTNMTGTAIGTVGNVPSVTGTGSVTKEGVGLLRFLAGSNNYSGNTTVSAGTLQLDSPNPNNQASTVSIADGAVLNLNFDEGVTDTVDKLFINGVQQAAGTYGTTASGAGNPDDIVFAGLGTLTVIHGPGGGTPFDTWMSTNYPGIPDADNDPDDDPDHDGRNNLEEFAFKGDPTDPKNNGLFLTELKDNSDPGSANELTFTMAVRRSAVNFAANGNNAQESASPIDEVTYTVEASATLTGTWNSTVSYIGKSDTYTGMPNLTGTDWEYRTFSAFDGLAGKGFIRAKAVRP